jgi:hypothetical protein
VTELLKPARGGFPRPFGCGDYARDLLLGIGPHGAPIIDTDVGATQADIFFYYKNALRRITAIDRATRTEEKRARKEKRLIDPDNIDNLTEEYLARIGYKGIGPTYHSFVSYFSTIQKLGWVEATGREEPSAFQEHYPEGQPRKYFRLTEAGRQASDAEWANPHRALYGKR